MKILIIGGTGTIGEPLTKILSESKENDIYIVSRHLKKFSSENIFFIKGNIFNDKFFEKLLRQEFDVIVDFMIWEPEKLKKRLDMTFNHCKQYILTSTASVYADSKEMITESNTKRLVDGYSAEERKQIQRYHIKKSMDDDIIMDSPYHNWTLIRPWVTFNTRKLPLVTVPKNVWLWRYLHEKTIYLPAEAMGKKCTYTYGGDVALAISKLVGNQKALGEIINIASDKTYTWGEVTEAFKEILQEIAGKPLKIQYVQDASVIWKNIPNQYDPIVHDRYFNRRFGMEKLNEICGEKIIFGELYENLKECLKQVIEELPDKKCSTTPDYNGIMDRLAKEHTPLNTFSSKKAKLKYLIFRSAFLSWIFRMYRFLKNDKYRYIYKKSKN